MKTLDKRTTIITINYECVRRRRAIYRVKEKFCEDYKEKFCEIIPILSLQ